MIQPQLSSDMQGKGPMVPDGSRRPGLTPVSLMLVLVIAYVLVKIQLVVVLVFLALLFATVIERPVVELERRRIPRGLSILLVYVGIIGTIALGTMLAAPLISDEADRFRAEAPAQLKDLRDSWADSRNGLLSGPGADALTRVVDQLEHPSPPPEELTIGIVTGIGGGVIGLITVLVMAFYYLMEKHFLRRLVLAQLALASRERVDRVWDNVEAQVGRWLRGQLTLCLIIGTASLIGYGVMGIRFWPLLGIWAGLTEIIPIVGPWLGGIPAVVIAMTQSWDKALMVAAFVVMLQFTENSVLVPRVMKGAVGLSPLTVFVAILAGTQYLGIAGALLAIPVAAAVQVILSDYLRTRRDADRAGELAMPNWRWMRSQLGLSGTPSGMNPPPPPANPSGSPPPGQPPSRESQIGSWSNQFMVKSGGRDSGDSPPDPGKPAAPGAG